MFNAVPLANHLHIPELHQHGIKTFQAKYGVDLEAMAAGYTAQFLELFPGYGPQSAA